jgi:hypothetical protein
VASVFWIPIYEILEARGLSVHLVNARHVRNLSGRKSDVPDAEWLRDDVGPIVSVTLRISLVAASSLLLSVLHF